MMVSDYFFSRYKDDEQPHIYCYIDRQPPYDIEITLPILPTETISAADETFFITLEKTSETASLLSVGSEIWNFQSDASVRANIQTVYQDFLTNLDGAGLAAAAINLIKMRLAQVMPMTFAESLYYHYGFDPAAGQIDLQAGMRLRVDYQTYQLVHPTQDQTLQGYVGSGTSFYQVTAYRYTDNAGATQLTLGFDPFLAETYQAVSEAASSNGSGGAGLIDIQQPAYRLPFFRLCYPTAFPSVSSAGYAGTEQNVTLVGADTWTDVEAAAAEYKEAGALTTVGKQAFYFRGRSLVIPEISIFVNDQPHYVSVGATVRQLVERYLALPPAIEGQDLSKFGKNLRLDRLLYEGLDSEPAYHSVHLEHYQVYGDGSDVFDLPVVKGDRLYLDLK